MKQRRLIPLILLMAALTAFHTAPAAAAPLPSAPVTATPESASYRPGVPITLYAGVAGDLFLGVRVDGVKVQPPAADAAGYMEVRTGANIVVTLHPALLDTLGEGVHTVEILSAPGTAIAQLLVGAPPVRPVGFEKSQGTALRALNAYHTAKADVLGTVGKGEAVTVVGFLGRYAVVEYEGGPAGLARLNADYLDVEFAAPVTGKTTGAADAYRTPDASGKPALRFKTDGLRVTLTGRRGSWYTLEYKERAYYLPADKIAL